MVTVPYSGLNIGMENIQPASRARIVTPEVAP
jgi:hypothetical protein